MAWCFSRLPRRIRFLSGGALLMVIAWSTGAAASPHSGGDWPRFRGPNSDSISTESAVFAGIDRVGLEVEWKQTAGSGYSGVAVVAGHVVTMFSDGKVDVVVDFDEDTGVERWRFEIGPTHVGHDGSRDGPIATPVIDERRVFGLHPDGLFFALDLDSGNLLWSSHLIEEYGANMPKYGLGTSPIVEDGVLILQLGAKDAAVAGFDPATGKRLWTAGSDTITYQCPIPWVFQAHRQVLAVGDQNLLTIVPRTGDVLWQHVHQGSGSRGVDSLVPVSAGPGRLFLAYRDDSSTLLELIQDGAQVSAQETWNSRSIRNSYNVPVYHEGYVYAFSSRYLTSVDAATGKSMWRSRQPGDGWLMLVDGHLIILTNQGSLHVTPASPDGYREIAQLAVFDESCWTPPSFAHGRIFARSHGEIARVDIRAGAGMASTQRPAEDVAPHSSFARFLTEAKRASDKKAVIDHFMASQDQFPVVEDDDRVHFVYRGPGDDLAIAGDMIGTRLEKPMTRVEGTDFFYYSTRLEPDARVNYVFIKDYEEITDPRNPRTTTSIVLGKDMEMSFTGAEMAMSWLAMPRWQEPDHLGKPDRSRRGRVRTWQIDSKHLEMNIPFDVYLPAGYQAGEQRYPVTYVHGGEPARLRGRWTRSLDNLIGKTVAPVIVVFIKPLAWGKDAQYAAMFAEELVPFVDEEFRTISSPEGRANVGISLSGFAALNCTFKHPGLVRKVACQSPLMLDAMMTELASLAKSPAEAPLTIYLEWGKYGLRNPREHWDMGESCRQFAEHLRSKGYTITGGEVHDGTGWSSWRNRTDAVMEALFPIHSAPKADG